MFIQRPTLSATQMHSVTRHFKAHFKNNNVLKSNVCNIKMTMHCMTIITE